MADIDRRRGKPYVRWRDPAGRQHSKTFATVKEARLFAAQVEVDLARGTYLDRRAGAVSLQEYALERWLPSRLHLRPNSRSTYEAHLRRHILPLLGGMPIGAIRRTDAKALAAALAAELAPSTTGTVFAVLRSVLSSAVEDGLIGANPCLRVPLPRVERPAVEPLAPDAVAALAAAVPERYELAVWLAAGAGLRQGEALGLTVPKVDFLRRRIAVTEQLQDRRLVPPKTRASRRVVPADDFLLMKVSEHMRRWPLGPGRLLITNRLVRPVMRNSFSWCWREAVKKAGLPEGTRYHDLRHTYASLLIHAGLHPKVIQARLGHATIGETMDTYGHLFPEAGELGRGLVDSAFAEGPRAHIAHI